MVYVHFANGFEEIEAITVVDILRRGGVDVKTVSIHDCEVVTGAHWVPIVCDLTFEQADYDACDMIVLPGGMPGTDNLNMHLGLGEKIMEFKEAGKWVAAICAAPLVLAELGVLEDKKATIYPGMEDRLLGVPCTGEKLCVDGKIITGQAPGAASEFAFAILKELKGADVMEEVKKDMVF